MVPLLLLHGATGAANQLQPLAIALNPDNQVHTLNFSGHGGNMVDKAFSIELFAANVLRYMEQEGLTVVSILGYSMGGYVAMYLARHYPEKIDKIITLATKYHWSETIAQKEIVMLQPDKILQKVPAFAQSLQERHQPADWKEVLVKTAAMMTALGANNTLQADDYVHIQTPSLLLLGDRDTMVSLDETVAVYKLLPNAQLGILPNTGHPIEQADTAQLAFIVNGFLHK